jgi:hypothetical protein
LNLPLKIYFDIAAALLAGLLILVWSIRRRRQERLAIYRVEPGTAGAANGNPRPAQAAESLDAPAFAGAPPDYPRLTPVDHKPSGSDAQALVAHPAAGARDYKGFKICLNEKRPGLWIAAVKRPGTRKKKGPVKDSELWITPEFYQLSAALADARAAIDRGAVGKPALRSSD